MSKRKQNKPAAPQGAPARTPASPAKAAKKGSFIKDLLLIVVYAVLIAALVKCFIVDTRIIPSTSMSPTIEVGDRVLMSRLSYLGQRSPQRGDIVVFDPPAELGEKYDFIKRVIGLPGETVAVSGGLVYVDGQPLDEPYLAEDILYEYAAVTVPAGEYFMLGDNRNYSGDSHRWLDPFIPEEDIKGKAICRYWPLDKIGAIYNEHSTD